MMKNILFLCLSLGLLASQAQASSRNLENENINPNVGMPSLDEIKDATQKHGLNIAKAKERQHIARSQGMGTDVSTHIVLHMKNLDKISDINRKLDLLQRNFALFKQDLEKLGKRSSKNKKVFDQKTTHLDTIKGQMKMLVQQKMGLEDVSKTYIGKISEALGISEEKLQYIPSFSEWNRMGNIPAVAG